MKRFIRYYISIRALWSIITFGVLLLSEKMLDLSSASSSEIILARVVFVLGCFISAYLPNIIMLNQISAKKTLLVSMLVLPTMLYTPYVGLFIVALVSVKFVSSINYLMSRGVKYNDKPSVNKKISLLTSMSGLLVYLLGSFFLNDRSKLLLGFSIIFILLVLTYIFLYKAIKIWVTSNTTDHMIISQQQKNAVASMSYGKPYFKLKDSLKITGVMIVFSIYFLFISTIDSLNTAYVRDILHKGQEVQFSLVFAFLLGATLVSFYQSYVVSRIRLSYMLQNSIMFIGIYVFILYQEASIWYLYGLMFLIGALANVINISVTLSIHQNTKPEHLKKRLNIYNAIIYISPVLSNLSIWVILTYTKLKLSEIYLGTALVCMLVISTLITIRLFRPKTKDMTYSKYR